nr:MAG TPA: hypothetical protein [Bacteriophage sp.]
MHPQPCGCCTTFEINSTLRNHHLRRRELIIHLGFVPYQARTFP